MKAKQHKLFLRKLTLCCRIAALYQNARYALKKKARKKYYLMYCKEKKVSYLCIPFRKEAAERGSGNTGSMCWKAIEKKERKTFSSLLGKRKKFLTFASASRNKATGFERKERKHRQLFLPQEKKDVLLLRSLRDWLRQKFKVIRAGMKTASIPPQRWGESFFRKAGVGRTHE